MVATRQGQRHAAKRRPATLFLNQSIHTYFTKIMRSLGSRHSYLLLAAMAMGMGMQNPSYAESAFGEEKGFIGMKNLHHENTKNTKRKKRRERGKK